jgi:hypothetical protein
MSSWQTSTGRVVSTGFDHVASKGSRYYRIIQDAWALRALSTAGLHIVLTLP